MKRFLTYILIGSIIGIGILGFILVDHNGMGIAPSDCIATTINGALCSSDPVASAIFHIQALQFFGTAIFSATAIILLILAFTAVIIVKFSKRLGTKIVSIAPISPAGSLLQIHFRQWLALHELSPPQVAAAR